MQVEKDYVIFNCPHCDLLIQVKILDIACGIFRHGAYKTNLIPINPHTPKDECMRLASDPNIVGCCKPFSLQKKIDGYAVEICEYK